MKNEYVFSIYDSFPVNKGHVLIITKRHVEQYFDLVSNEKKAIDQEILFF